MTSSTRQAGHDAADDRNPVAPPAGSVAAASTGELMTRLSAQVPQLVRAEFELAKAELAVKGKRAGVGAGMLGAGGVLATFGVATLVAAAVAALALVTPVWLAAVIVGVVLLIIAGILALVGRSSLSKAAPPVPQDALVGVQEDIATVKDAVRR